MRAGSALDGLVRALWEADARQLLGERVIPVVVDRRMPPEFVAILTPEPDAPPVLRTPGPITLRKVVAVVPVGDVPLPDFVSQLAPPAVEDVEAWRDSGQGIEPLRA